MRLFLHIITSLSLLTLFVSYEKRIPYGNVLAHNSEPET